MRSKLTVAGLSLLVAAGIVVALTPTAAPADATVAPALVIHEGGCGVLNGDGGVTFASIRNAVITNNGKGTGKLTCKVKGAPNSTGTAQIFNFDNTGLLCGTPSGATARWTNVVSASGNVTLSCHTP
jgi:hypothetical protein